VLNSWLGNADPPAADDGWLVGEDDAASRLRVAVGEGEGVNVGGGVDGDDGAVHATTASATSIRAGLCAAAIALT